MKVVLEKWHKCRLESTVSRQLFLTFSRATHRRSSFGWLSRRHLERGACSWMPTFCAQKVPIPSISVPLAFQASHFALGNGRRCFGTPMRAPTDTDGTHPRRDRATVLRSKCPRLSPRGRATRACRRLMYSSIVLQSHRPTRP